MLAAVRLVREEGLGVGVLVTGHGVASPCNGGVLINTSRMRGIRVNPEARTVRVEAGVLWRDVIPEAQAFGLVGLLGSSSGVGVVGYTLGGGFGWLGRKYGFNAESIREADVVTADGELLRVDAYEHPDLFWGLKGSAGNFGAVTSLEFALYPLTTSYGEGLYYPVERAAEALDLYRRGAAGLPNEMTTSISFMNFPPLPVLPEPLRGRSVSALRACTSETRRRRAKSCSVPGASLAIPCSIPSGRCPTGRWT
jgi:FAD/FMN-containing dehydrogenase